MPIQRLKGTQDILPETAEYWQDAEAIIRKTCREFGYEEIRTPIFELTELFVRGVGETTDIVNKEMYTFTDKGGNSLTLRPEGTASVCRAYVEDKLYGQVQQPVKLYYMGAMFRHEKPQAGRFRQFHQFGVEVLGADKPVVDAEVIHLAWEIYRRLGLTGLEVHLNSVGCPHCRALHKQKLQEFLAPRLGALCKDCQERFERNPLRILDCKQPSCREATADAPAITEYLCEDCRSHAERLQELLAAAGIPYSINPRLVRGLDYYRKTAFEIMVEEIGAQSAICGGGRYDGLVEEIGGPPTPAIGFAMGLERVLAALRVQEKLSPRADRPFAVVVTLGERATGLGFQTVSRLRQAGIPVSMDLLGRSLKSQLKAADRNQIRVALILGDEELDRGVMVVRDLILGEQSEVSQDEIVRLMEEQYGKYQKDVR
ncbi:MAG: histidine--tRNA ligase [Peptococcaceae bacterium]|jgi:histidyl-tRNA synthetase|nr:histidine--tRNA ligase [Peptococcaceae bacterium]